MATHQFPVGSGKRRTERVLKCFLRGPADTVGLLTQVPACDEHRRAVILSQGCHAIPSVIDSHNDLKLYYWPEPDCRK